VNSDKLQALIHAQNRSLRRIRLAKCTVADVFTPFSLDVAPASCTELADLTHTQTTFQLLEPTSLPTKLIKACIDWPTCAPADAWAFIRRRRLLLRFELSNSMSSNDLEGWTQAKQDAQNMNMGVALSLWEELGF
jgi:hypothetical protein